MPRLSSTSSSTSAQITNRPKKDSSDQAHGARARVFLLTLREVVAQPEKQAAPSPETRLQNQRGDEDAIHHFFQRGGQRQEMGAQVQADGR